jgi:hypothetical protein
MSRDPILEPDTTLTRPSSESAGREMPRGGRSGSKERPSTVAPADIAQALAQQIDIPRTDDRRPLAVDREVFHLRGTEVETLAAIGAFRVVDTNDFGEGVRRDRWHSDLNHLRDSQLIECATKVLDGRSTTIVTLTRTGRTLLEAHQHAREDQARQAYYAGFVKPRELAHDSQVYRAYKAAATRLHATGARVQRVVLDYELKRDYQRFLQANNKARGRASGRPDRSRKEIEEWAKEHRLSIVEDRVQFPDVRIEYEQPDGRRGHEDLEVATEHYNARQMGAKQAAGFQMHGTRAGRLGGAGGRGGASPFDPHHARQVLR